MSKHFLSQLLSKRAFLLSVAAVVGGIGVVNLLARPASINKSESPVIVSNTLITPTLITNQTLTLIATGAKVAISNTGVAAKKETSCKSTPVSQSRLASSDSIIAKLASGAETACGGQVFSGAMRFFSPNPVEAEEWQADTLKEASRLGMDTIIVLETDSMDFNDIAAGKYDQQLQSYFKNLSNHVSAADLGTVVVCGEPIVGERPGANADNFVACIQHFSDAAKAAFPDIKLSTIVDEAEFVSLNSVLPKLKSTGISSVGIQAFSNGEPITFNGNRPNLDSYFDTSKIKSAIAKMGIDNIWLNTGITKADKGQGVTYSNEQRQQVAAELARRIKLIGNVKFVNLFMENKYQLPEGRDFSVTAEEPEWLNRLIADLGSSYTLYGFDN